MLHDDCETGALTASGFHASERSSSGCVHNYWLGCEDGPVSDSPTMPLENAHPRPPVAVVMPFAGTAVEARESLGALATLITRPGDTVRLADNSATAPADATRVVPAPGERSPARARNAGAAAVGTDIPWLLFLDADCRPARDLLDAFFVQPIPDDVGAVAGEIQAIPSGDSLAARFGASRNFLNSATHMAHPFRNRHGA
jgi:hypothetical protein